MVNPIPESVQKLWDQWNIRGALLFSLLLQILLIWTAPLRKRTSSKPIIVMVWSGYLLADATATFAVGLISNTRSKSDSDAKANQVNSQLLAFWAPFLLLHLGGPDTITAFSLEDNELWLRHLLSLLLQALATGYVFIQTMPSNELTIPTLLLFLAGIIKYLERTRSLYLASMDRFRDSMLKKPDPGPDYAQIMENYATVKQAKPSTRIIMISEIELGANYSSGVAPKSIKLDDQLQVVQIAVKFFKTFKGLVVDLIFDYKERRETRQFFHSISAEDALRIMETELNFLYEVLFTKVVVLYSKWGYFFRSVSFSSILIALSLFHFRVHKGHFNGFDVGVTYALLYGAIGLDIMASGAIILSDWRVASLEQLDEMPETHWESIAAFFNKVLIAVFRKLLDLRRLRWSPYQEGHNLSFNALATPLFVRRWSGRVSGHNLIRFCLKGRPRNKKKRVLCGAKDCIQQVIQFTHLDVLIPLFRILNEKVIEFTGLRDFVDEITYVSREPLTRELWEFIFYELQWKSSFADSPETAKRICSTWGDWVLQDRNPEKYAALIRYTSKVAYDQSLLTWHIATELLYNADEQQSHQKEFSKTLSDYMVYLLIMQPTLMAAVAGIGKIRFQDTLAEAERFFQGKGFKPNDQKKACESILKLETAAEPILVKGERSKSVLFDGSMLAKELGKLEDDKWKITSKVWVEMMSYAAIHCRAYAQAQQLSKGGELITVLWLLMAHFGLGDQFQTNEAQARAKLVAP